MTLKELCERRNNMNNPEELRIGLGILEYYVEKIEKVKKYEVMSSYSDIIYGILVGLKMTNYINDVEFESLKKNKESYESDFFNRTMDKILI